ncbi:hypothetical protein KM043_012347 [Ampulex compressa]|nr:hypothetical protein KM043_012347 [Ampulex compressa]
MEKRSGGQSSACPRKKYQSRLLVSRERRSARSEATIGVTWEGRENSGGFVKEVEERSRVDRGVWPGTEKDGGNDGCLASSMKKPWVIIQIILQKGRAFRSGIRPDHSPPGVSRYGARRKQGEGASRGPFGSGGRRKRGRKGSTRAALCGPARSGRVPRLGGPGASSAGLSTERTTLARAAAAAALRLVRER